MTTLAAAYATTGNNQLAQEALRSMLGPTGPIDCVGSGGLALVKTGPPLAMTRITPKAAPLDSFGCGRIMVDGHSLTYTDMGCLGPDPSQDTVARWAARLRGHYIVVLSIPRTGDVYVIADRTSTIPMYWRMAGDIVVIAAEALPLARAQVGDARTRVTLRHDAIYEFMASGHLWGDDTYWNEVQRVGPGSMLRLQRTGPQVVVYWEMRPQPMRMSWQEAQSRLSAAIQADMACVPDGNGVLTLSGGADSRALLGLMHRTGRRCEAVSYSYGDQFAADHDMEIGRYYARKLGVPHHVYCADVTPDRIIRDFERTVEITGGETDAATAQEAILGEEFYADMCGRYDWMLRGDEVWGWGDGVLSAMTALWQVFLLTLDQLPQPRQLLRTQAFAQGLQCLSIRHRQMIAQAAGHGYDFNAMKDYLYWRHREARLLQNIAYFRRRYLPHFAPFLFGHALEVVKTLPAPMRIRKKLFLATVTAMFPDLFTDSAAPIAGTPVQSRFTMLYAHAEYRDYIRTAIISNPPAVWDELFDREALDKWMSAVVLGPVQQKPRSDRRFDRARRIYAIMKASGPLRDTAMMFAIWTRRLRFPARDVTYLNRLLTLSRALTLAESAGHLHSGGHAPQATATPRTRDHDP